MNVKIYQNPRFRKNSDHLVEESARALDASALQLHRLRREAELVQKQIEFAQQTLNAGRECLRISERAADTCLPPDP